MRAFLVVDRLSGDLRGFLEVSDLVTRLRSTLKTLGKPTVDDTNPAALPI